MKSQVIANFAPLTLMNAEIEAHKNDRVKVGVLAAGGRNYEGKVVKSRVERFDIYTSTTQHEINNPTLGLSHEFGVASLNIPPRSFLRMPLISELPNKMRQIGKNVWADLIAQKGLRHSLEQLGLIAVQTIEMAFATGGFGRWQPLKPQTIARKGSSAILIDSAQLRKSVSFAIVEAAP